MAVAEVLELEVGLRGVDNVLGGLDGITDRFDKIGAKLAKLATPANVFLASMAALSAIGLRRAMEFEEISVSLEAVTGSMEKAERIMALLQAREERGVFNLSELGKAAFLFERIGADFARYDELTERLAARMPGHDLAQAAELVTRILSGFLGRVAMQLRDAGITVQQLRAQGIDVTDRGQVNATPDALMKALENITAQGPDVIGRLEESLTARWNRLVNKFQDAFIPIGNVVISVLSPVLTVFDWIVTVLTRIDELTGGWLGKLALVAATVLTFEKIYTFMKGIELATKAAAFWQGIYAMVMNGLASGIGLVLALRDAYLALAAGEGIAAAAAIVLDFATGNIASAAAALAAAALLGVSIGAAAGALTGGGDKQAQALDRNTDAVERNTNQLEEGGGGPGGPRTQNFLKRRYDLNRIIAGGIGSGY